MNKAKVSVIVPVYNTEQYLTECIESILGQTHENLELFLVDDGSTDDSLRVCREYEKKDPRIVVLTKSNGGQGSARNRALERVTGQYISFVDSDDYLDPTMYTEMLQQMDQHNADLGLCFICKKYSNGTMKKESLPEPLIMDNQELMRKYMSSGLIHTGPCNKLYKSNLFLSTRFPEIRANEDAYIMHEVLSQCTKAVHLGKALYIQNIRSDSTEQKPFSEHNLILLECARRLIDFYAENYPKLLHIVAYKEVNDTAALMRRILVSGVYLKYLKLYRSLHKSLQEKYAEVRKQYPDDEKMTAYAKEAIQKHGRFLIMNFLRGVKHRIVR